MRFPFSPTPDPDLYLRCSPLGPLWALLTGSVPVGVFWGGLVVCFFTLFFGRFFCGWVCPLGTCIDVTDAAVAPRSPSTAQPTMQHTRYVILLGGLVATFFSVNVLWYFDPLSLFTRLTTVILFPCMTWLVSLVLKTLAIIPGVASIDWYWRRYVFIEGQASHLQTGALFLVCAGLFLLARSYRRGWCRFVCPAGAFLGLLSRLLPLGRSVTEECIHCDRCSRECRMGAIPTGKVALTHPDHCIQCLECGVLCPVPGSAIRFGVRPRLHPPLDLGRRELMQGVLAGITATGLHRLDAEQPARHHPLLRPPGAVPEADFLQRCLRCLACVRVCHTNGGCLQPADGSSRLLDRWTPVAVMRLGYCEHNCNLCGQVCPTGAILPLSLKDKQENAMGLAVFDRNVCIPHARAEDCLVCEEHCPIGDKAIRFDQREVRAPDGSTRLVKLPYVVKDKCIGCGICEAKCPLKGNPGIFVTPENADRPRHSI
ncbi:MAG TPA: 4Fe-4S binding protein [Candidatus Ozemobacteraceae bacterium]|nr:4Fe-4S binding protein [Candidatus Ozemobacteraceae bacterium]